MKTLDTCLQLWTDQLKKAGVATARLDSLVLLEDVTDKDRSYLLAHPEFELAVEQLEELEQKITRRCMHEPLAYIRKKSEFYGREFYVDNSVLQPRPETEDMIDLFKELTSGTNTIAADIGTGSGCIAITVKLECPTIDVIATDVSEECLEIASTNAMRYGLKMSMLQGNLLEPLLNEKVEPTALLCNLPYVPKDYEVNKSATHEPDIALYAGTDGLDSYRVLFSQCNKFSRLPETVFTESLISQHELLAEIAVRHGYQLHTTRGLIQVFTARA